MARGRSLLCALALLLAGCALGGGAHAAALERWAARAEARYLLSTDERVRGRPCGQIVEVRDGAVVDIVSNTCGHPSLWTVEWLFHRARTAEAAPVTCARRLRGVGCVCSQRVAVEVEYDAERGYPRRIHSVQRWERAWGEAGFWRELARTASIPACVPPRADEGWTIEVRELRPLP